MRDPELADAPEHPDAIAWEVRHCADRLESLAELGDQTFPKRVCRRLRLAATNARFAASELDGGTP